MGGYAEYYGQTNIHPLGLVAVLVMGLMVIMLPRRHSLVPFIVAACMIPMSQRIMIGPGDFTFLRLLILLAWIRILMRGEMAALRWRSLDTAVVVWCLTGTTIFTAYYGTVEALVNRAGWMYDILGTYLLVRCMIRSWDDIVILSRWFAVISVPVAIAFTVEWVTRYNMFSVFGGVPARTFIREGRLRCQGAFAHPILAGTFWAAVLPMIWMLWWNGGRDRVLCVFGTAASLLVIAACSSSTPVLSALAVVGVAILYKFRDHRRLMWLGLIAGLFALHLVMNRPVWHLMARVDITGGSTGWHRFIIFDTFLRHFPDWWFMGESDPMSWGVWQMRDITNQYVLEGLRGGLWTLLAFLVVLVVAYANVGRLLTLAKKAQVTSATPIIWFLGGALFMHTWTFFAVSYFGQMTTIWYVQLAMIGSMMMVYGKSSTMVAGIQAPQTHGAARTRRRVREPLRVA